jgi:CheY-like chemotaxis protein
MARPRRRIERARGARTNSADPAQDVQPTLAQRRTGAGDSRRAPWHTRCTLRANGKKLPMTRPAATRPPLTVPSTTAVGRVPRSPRRILVANGDRELRRLLAIVLRSDGHEVVEAADGSELLEAIASLVIDGGRPFDLIMSAQAMPGLPGVSVLTGLRARGRRTPFVLLTGHPLVQAQARRLGAVVLDRPFDAAAIRRAVQQAEELVSPEG